MTLHIDSAKAAKMLAEAVLHKPEGFKYIPEESGYCSYVHGILPGVVPDVSRACSGCIIGDVLLREGLTFMDLIGESGCTNRYFGALPLLDKLSKEGKITITSKAVTMFLIAQEYQDSGETWSYAVMKAIVSGF